MHGQQNHLPPVPQGHLDERDFDRAPLPLGCIGAPFEVWCSNGGAVGLRAAGRMCRRVAGRTCFILCSTMRDGGQTLHVFPAKAFASSSWPLSMQRRRRRCTGCRARRRGCRTATSCWPWAGWSWRTSSACSRHTSKAAPTPATRWWWRACAGGRNGGGRGRVAPVSFVHASGLHCA